MITKEWLDANPDYTCGCGIYVHPSKRNMKALHIPDCQFYVPTTTGLPAFMLRDFERAIESALHPVGMSTHDGKARVDANALRRLLSTLAAAEARASAAEKDAEATFPMLDGPRIPWWLARIVFAGYHAMHSGQALERIAERGGFAWGEVSLFWKDLRRGKPAMQAAIAARAAQTPP